MPRPLVHTGTRRSVCGVVSRPFQGHIAIKQLADFLRLGGLCSSFTFPLGQCDLLRVFREFRSPTQREEPREPSANCNGRL
jgi:hypothetical protein